MVVVVDVFNSKVRSILSPFLYRTVIIGNTRKFNISDIEFFDLFFKREKKMKLVEVKHPLVKHKLGVMREADIDTKKFRELATEVGSLLT